MKKHLTLFLVMLAAVLDTRAQSISVSQPAPYDLSTTDSTLTLQVTMKLEGQGNFTELHVPGGRPAAVNLNGSPRSELIGAFELKQGDRPNQLAVKISPRLLPTIGTYEVTVAYYFGTDAAKATTFNFSVARPAAVLVSDNTLAAGLAGTELYHNQLTLRETGGRAAVLALKPMPVSVDKYGRAGLLIFDKTVYSVPAGGSLVLDYRPDKEKIEELPVGVYLAKLNFSSNTLTNSGLTIIVEIANKRGKWWIIVIVLAGLGVGFGVRIVLKNSTDSEQARLGSLLLEKQIADDSKDIHDADFQKNVRKIIDELVLKFKAQAGQAIPVTTLTKAVTDAKDAYNQLRSNFDLDLKSVSKDYDLFAHPVFDAALSTAIAGQLKAVRASLLVMKKNLDELDVTSARITYLDAGALFNRFVTAYQLYMNGVAALITAGSFWPNEASVATKTALGQQAANITTLAAQLQPSATAYLQTMTTISQLQTLADGLGDTVENLLLGDYKKADSTAAANAGFLAALKSYANGFRNMAANTPAQNSPASHFGANLLAQLDNAWTAAVSPPNMQQIAGFLAGAMPLGGIFQHAGQIAAAAANTAGVVNFLLSRHSGPQLLDAAITRSLKRYYILNAIQTVLLTLLISLAAYKVYGEGWIGTWPDMLALFLGAFSVDIAASSITDLKSKVQ